MVDEERITYEDIKQRGIKIARILIEGKPGNNTMFLEMEDGTKKQVGEKLDTVTLYGVRYAIPPETGGPFFIAVIEEGILSIYGNILYKIAEEKAPALKTMRVYLLIW